MRCAAPWLLVVLAFARAGAAQQPALELSGRAPPRIALLPTHTDGIDPVIAGYVDRALQRAAAAAGGTLIGAEQVRSAQQALAPPVSLADLWRVTHRAGAELGVSALVSADRGRYAVHVRVASSDGRGPFAASGLASHLELEATVERLLAETLARALDRAPTAAEARAPAAPPPGVAAPTPVAPPPRVVPTRPPARPPAAGAGAAASESAPARSQLRLALHNDLAFGLAEDSFINEVLGARADLRLDAGLWLGLHVGYANLEGRGGRVHGLLPYAQIEQRMPLAPGRALAIPLRLGLGYLLRNGGFLRLSSGIAIPLGARNELVLDLIAPAFWTTRDKTLFSLDAGVELNVEL